ncbi:MAG TPA: glycosyltransferase family A protein [Flavisolibacter sp.]|jgi:glycosyltransferase involved in cell wall biosynthesis|nr:glycosyltransferase family A protein [Flavisolibacter sp.]
MDRPLVSVLITAYNREEYIAEAIESVLTSSYANFELIIVDDCSSDKTVSTARKYAKNDARIKLFMNEANLGQFANRNLAASYASGEFIKYVDSDDKIYPHTLEMMVKAMLCFPEAGLGFCLTHGPCKRPLPYQVNSTEALHQHYFGGGLLFCGPSGLIIRRSAFERVGGFEEYGMPSDNHLALKIGAMFPVVAMTRDLFWWRIHPLQEFSLKVGRPINILNNYKYNSDIIRKYSVLSIEENRKVLYNLKKIFWLNLFKLAVHRRKPMAALKLALAISKKPSLSQ